MRRRSSRRVFKRGKRQYIWTATVFNNVAIDLTALTTVLLNSDDWADVAGFKRGGCLERIRGWTATMGQAALSEASVLANYWFEYISKTKSDVVAFPAPDLAASYVSEDILWTSGGGQHYVQGTTSLATPMSIAAQYREVDVKARRSLVADDIIIHTMGERVNNSIELERCGVIRCLISEP